MDLKPVNDWENVDSLWELATGRERLNLNGYITALQFYEGIKDLPLCLLENHYESIVPRSFFDEISYHFDEERKGRRVALFVARSNRYKKDIKERNELLRKMQEEGKSGSISDERFPPPF